MDTDQRKKMSRPKKKNEVETLAWITDDEAEFWTSITASKDELSPTLRSEASKTKKLSSSASLPDGSYFKFDDKVEDEAQQKLNQKIIENRNRQLAKISQENEDQSKQNYPNGEKNQSSKIIPGINDQLKQARENDKRKKLSEMFPGVNYQLNQTNKNDEQKQTSVSSQGIDDQLKQSIKNEEQKKTSETSRGIDDQSKIINENGEKKETSDTLQSDENMSPKNKEMPGANKSFIGQLFNELKGSSPRRVDSLPKEEPSEPVTNEMITTKINNTNEIITTKDNNTNEITTTKINNTNEIITTKDNNTNELTTKKDNNTNDILSVNDKNNLTKDGIVVEKVRSFIGDLGEETDVIRGTLDEETFLNRRSRQAKVSRPSADENTKPIRNDSI